MSTATLSWTNPIARTDGTPLSPDEIASVDVLDAVDGAPAEVIGSVTGAGTSFTTGLLSVGSHAFSVVVNDTTGHKSAPSNTAIIVIAPTLAAPNAVTDLSATPNP